MVSGILALVWPYPTKVFLFLLFGTMLLMEGILTSSSGIAWHGHFDGWWAILLRGLTGIILGLMTFYLVDLNVSVLLRLVVLWAFITGVLEIVTAIRLRRVLVGEWTLMANGLLTVLVGFLLFTFPVEIRANLAGVLGICAMIAGSMVMIFGFRKRSILHELERTGAALSESN